MSRLRWSVCAIRLRKTTDRGLGTQSLRICLLLLASWLLVYVALKQTIRLRPLPAASKLVEYGDLSGYYTVCYQLNRRNVSADQHNSSVIDACKRLREYYFKPRTKKVYTFRSQLLRTGNGICSKNTFMVVVVLSHHTHVDRRAAIRATWGGAAVNGTWPDSLTHAYVSSTVSFQDNACCSIYFILLQYLLYFIARVTTALDRRHVVGRRYQTAGGQMLACLAVCNDLSRTALVSK